MSVAEMKCSFTIKEYLQLAKSVTDSLSAIQKPVDKGDLVWHIHRGLTPDYESLVTSLITHIEPLTFKGFKDSLSWN